MRTRCMLCPVVLVAGWLIAAPAQTRAQDAQNHTTLTLSGPVEIPGTTLPAGTYVFETTPGQGGRQSVRITSADGSKLIATAEAVPMRREGALTNVVQFRPTILGSGPTALQGWFRSGSADGYQFVYPAGEAAEIANRTDTRVVASATETGKDTSLVVIDAYGKRSPWSPAS
jgi:hypothetical protein